MITEQQIANALDGHFYRVPNPDFPATVGRRRNFDDTDRRRLIAMYRSGKTLDYIADALDYPRHKLPGHIRELVDESVLHSRRKLG